MVQKKSRRVRTREVIGISVDYNPVRLNFAKANCGYTRYALNLPFVPVVFRPESSPTRKLSSDRPSASQVG
jgi:hypothetical protein